MSGTEQRRVAVEALVEFGHGYADAMAELGCPHRQTLRDRWEGYGSTGRVPTGKGRTRKSGHMCEPGALAPTGPTQGHTRFERHLIRAADFRPT